MMTHYAPTSASSINSSTDIDSFLKDISEPREQFSKLCSLANEACEQANSNTFFITKDYLSKHFSDKDLAFLNDLSISFINHSIDESIINRIFSYDFDEEWLLTALFKHFKQLEEQNDKSLAQTISTIVSILDKQKKYITLKGLFLQLPALFTNEIPLEKLNIEDWLELLAALKSQQIISKNDENITLKQQAIFEAILNRSESLEKILQSEYKSSFVHFFLDTFNHYPKQAEILLTLLESKQLNYDAHAKEKLNAALLAILKTYDAKQARYLSLFYENKEKNIIRLLNAYQEYAGEHDTLAFMASVLVEDKSNFEYFKPFLLKQSSSKVLAFLNLEPLLTTEQLVLLLTKIDESQYISLLKILENNTLDEKDTSYTTIYEFIAKNYQDKTPEAIASLLTEAANQLDSDNFSIFIAELFTQFHASTQQVVLISVLITALKTEAFKPHKERLLPYLRTSCIELLKNPKKNILAKGSGYLLSFIPGTSSDNQDAELLTLYYQQTQTKEFLTLCFHLETTSERETLDKALKIVSQTPTLAIGFFSDERFSRASRVKVVEGISNDILIELIDSYLEEDRYGSTVDIFLLELCKRLSEKSTDEKLANQCRDNFFKEKPIATAILQSPECLKELAKNNLSSFLSSVPIANLLLSQGASSKNYLEVLLGSFSDSNNAQIIHQLSLNLLLFFHDKPDELIAFLNPTGQSIPHIKKFSKAIKTELMQLLVPGAVNLSERKLSACIHEHAKNKSLKPFAYTLIAKDFTTTENYLQAAKQLELVDFDLASLDLSQWNNTVLIGILNNSSPNSVNWAHVANIIKSKELLERTEFTQKLINDLLCLKTKQAVYKTQLITFIKENLFTKEIIDGLTLSDVQILIAHLNLTDIIDDQLVLHKILEFRHSSHPKEELTLCNKIAQNVLRTPRSYDSFKLALQHNLFRSPKALAIILKNLQVESVLSKKCLHKITKLLSEFTAQEKKEFFIEATSETNLSLLKIQAIQPFFSELKLNSLYDDTDSKNNTTVVTNYLKCLLNHENISDSDTFLKLIPLCQDIFVSLTHQSQSWAARLFEISEVKNFIIELLNRYENTQALKETSAEFIFSLNYILLTQLKQSIESGSNLSLTNQFFKLLSYVLSQESFAERLSVDSFCILYRQLPKAQQVNMAQELLKYDPIPTWLSPHIKLLAANISVSELNTLFQNHSETMLFAQLLLLKQETYEYDNSHVVTKVLQEINQTSAFISILDEISPQVLPYFVHACIDALCNDNILEWLKGLNLPNKYLIQFANFVVDEDKEKFAKELHDSRSIFGYSAFEYELQQAVKSSEIYQPLCKESLLYSMLEQWMNTPNLTSDFSSDTLRAITDSLNVSETLSVIKQHLNSLDENLHVTELFKPFEYDLYDYELYLVAARWFTYLPMITASRISAKEHINNICQMDKEAQSQVDDTLVTALLEIKKHIKKKFQHHSINTASSDDNSNPYYVHFTALLDLVKRAIDIDVEDNDANNSIKAQLTLLHDELIPIKCQVDRSLRAIEDEASPNTILLMQPSTRLLNVEKTKNGPFPRCLTNQSDINMWKEQLGSSSHVSNARYIEKAKGLRAIVQSIIKTYAKDRSISRNQQTIIKKALLSSHELFVSNQEISDACSLLSPADLDELFKEFQFDNTQFIQSIDLLGELKEVDNARTRESYIDEFIASLSDLSTTQLSNIHHLATSAKAMNLANLIHHVVVCKRDKTVEPSFISIPKSMNVQAEQFWLEKDIERTISQTQSRIRRYKKIYEATLSYSKRNANQSYAILTRLSSYDHDILDGEHVAKLLNSYIPPLIDESLNFEAMEIALYNLFNSCDYIKQSIIIKNLKPELINRILNSCLFGLSSPDKERVRRSEYLIDIFIAYCQRADVNNSELRLLIKKNLDRANFEKYADKLGILTDELTKPSSEDSISQQSPESATFDGIWIQRIITNPTLVAKLTSHELHELIERYRLLSKFLKRDEYEHWEQFSPQKIKEIKIEQEKHRDRLKSDAKKLSKSGKKALEDDINQCEQRIERIEDKKRRLLNFKANDAIRELTRQLQRNILSHRAVSERTAATATLQGYFSSQLANYKSDILSRAMNSVYHMVLGEKGDLQRPLKREASILTRLIDKYLYHDNFVTSELKSVNYILSVGSILYNEQGEPVCRLDERLTLVKLNAQEACDEDSISISTKEVPPHTLLFSSDKTLVGSVSNEGTLNPNSVFMSQTSVDFILYTPLNELESLTHLAPFLFDDLIKQGALPYIYQAIYIDNKALEDKKEWIVHSLQDALCRLSNYQLSDKDATALAKYHKDFFTLIDSFAKNKKTKNALSLITAWLKDSSLVERLFNTPKLCTRLFDLFAKLNITNDELLVLQGIQYTHQDAGKVTQLIEIYRTCVLKHNSDTNCYTNILSQKRQQNRDEIQHVNVTYLTPEMLNRFTKERAIATLISPQSYQNITSEQFNVLFNRLNKLEQKLLYQYLLTYNVNELYQDRLLTRLISQNFTLLFDTLNELTSGKNTIEKMCFSSNLIIQALHQNLQQSTNDTSSIPLRSLFKPEVQPLIKGISIQSFLFAATIYINGYNNSVELKDLLYIFIHERLNQVIDSALLSDEDLKTIILLLEHESFQNDIPECFIAKNLYNQVIELAAGKSLSAIFYRKDGSLNADFMARTLKRSLLEDAYDNLSAGQQSNSWTHIKKVMKSGGTIIQRLPLVGQQRVNSWADFQKASLDEIRKVQSDIKAIDLYLLNFINSDDSTNKLLAKLLNDYLLTFYVSTQGSNAFIPDKEKLRLLHSTISLLKNDNVSSNTKQTIFEAINNHPRLRDSEMLKSISEYNFLGLIKQHGERQEYQEVINIEQQLSSDDTSKQNIARKAAKEARVELSIAQMKRHFYTPIVVWLKRTFNYGFNLFSFSPRKPIYVKKASVGQPPEVTQSPLNASYTFLKPLATPSNYSSLTQSLSSFLSNVSKQQMVCVEDATDLLNTIEDFCFSYQSTIDEERAYRENLNKFYCYVFKHKHEFKEHLNLLSKHKDFATTNRKRLLTLISYSENRTSAANIRALLNEELDMQRTMIGNSDLNRTSLHAFCEHAGLIDTTLNEVNPIMNVGRSIAVTA